MEEKVWLSSPHMGGGEMKYIQDAFDENWIAPLGPNVNGLEADLQNYLGQNSSVTALSSGTAAIHLSLLLLGVGAGDYVICQSLTFVATANPILYVGAIPLFVDSERTTWNLCPNAVEEAIKFGISQNKKPKAIITVSLYGMPYQVQELKALSEQYDIPIIEDSAEALGSSYQGEQCGTFGDLSVISFNGNKIITCSGGGALISKNPDHKKKAIFYATQAKDEALHYEHSTIGYNYRMSNISAGIGRGQMEVLPERIAQRRANHSFYQEIFKNREEVKLHTEPSTDFYSNFWLNTITFTRGNAGLGPRMIDEFTRANIETRPIWKPMHLQPVFAGQHYFGGTVAEELFSNGLCLPSGSNLKDSHKARISDLITRMFF